MCVQCARCIENEPVWRSAKWTDEMENAIWFRWVWTEQGDFYASLTIWLASHSRSQKCSLHSVQLSQLKHLFRLLTTVAVHVQLIIYIFHFAAVCLLRFHDMIARAFIPHSLSFSLRILLISVVYFSLFAFVILYCCYCYGMAQTKIRINTH